MATKPLAPGGIALDGGWRGERDARPRPPRPGRCPACGYAREGLPPGSRCPECGEMPDSPAVRSDRRRRALRPWRLAAGIIFALALVASLPIVVVAFFVAIPLLIGDAVRGGQLDRAGGRPEWIPMGPRAAWLGWSLVVMAGLTLLTGLGALDVMDGGVLEAEQRCEILLLGTMLTIVLGALGALLGGIFGIVLGAVGPAPHD